MQAPFLQSIQEESSSPVLRDAQKENNIRRSDDDLADDLHVLSASLESCQPYPSQNSRTSKAERVLGLTSLDLDHATSEAKSRKNRQPTPTISVDSPEASSVSLQSPSTAESPSTTQAGHFQKNNKKSLGGFLLPVDRRGFAQASSSSDSKLMENGLEVESDVEQSVGDEGSAKSSPMPRKKRTETRGRDRFKKILQPLTRSRSAGATDRAPPYALFLRHQLHEPKPVNRSSDNVTRNSSECTESEEEVIDGATSNKVFTPKKKKVPTATLR